MPFSFITCKAKLCAYNIIRVTFMSFLSMKPIMSVSYTCAIMLKTHSDHCDISYVQRSVKTTTSEPHDAIVATTWSFV
jgi:hypothetical protein